jgi:Ca2+-binding RTX toxin-like protein
MKYGAGSYSEILSALIIVENVAPTLEPIGSHSVLEGTLLQFIAKATDPGGFVVYSLADGAAGDVPDGAVIDGATGLFSWTPTAQGYYTFDVCASDGEASDCETIVVKVYGDIPITGFKADGYSTVNVSYQINAGPAGGFPFAIHFYRSADPVFDGGDSLLSSAAIDNPADLSDGNHGLAFTLGVDVALVSDANESHNDYYLLAVSETGFVAPDEDNTAVFSGAYQYPGATNVFVHGTEAADTVFAGSNNLALNGDGYYYGEAIGLRVRVHKGDDVVSSNFTGPVALFGGAGNDLLSGGNWPDYIDGGEGDNTLRGRGGSDVLLGGSGNDLLIGGNGNDALKGGAGNDTAAFPGQTAVNANLSTGIATGLGTDTVTDVENLTGSDSRVGDVLIGNNGPNILDGGRGPDVLDGRLGADTLLGGGGADKLTAGGGCAGDGKVDMVDGGTGHDTAADVINDVDTLIDVESEVC